MLQTKEYIAGKETAIIVDISDVSRFAHMGRERDEKTGKKGGNTREIKGKYRRGQPANRSNYLGLWPLEVRRK